MVFLKTCVLTLQLSVATLAMSADPYIPPYPSVVSVPLYANDPYHRPLYHQYNPSQVQDYTAQASFHNQVYKPKQNYRPQPAYQQEPSYKSQSNYPPQRSYPPKPKYKPPQPTYKPPQPTYKPAKPSYKPPNSNYGKPSKPVYPSYEPKPSYKPKPEYRPEPNYSVKPVYKPIYETHQPEYKPRPTSHQPAYGYEEEYYEPKPYAFDYGVNDEYTGTNFGHSESSDGKAVTGTYSVVLPDGRLQRVRYVADHQNGYQAEVTYEHLEPYY